VLTLQLADDGNAWMVPAPAPPSSAVSALNVLCDVPEAEREDHDAALEAALTAQQPRAWSNLRRRSAHTGLDADGVIR
jgi:acyl-CoA reductase-like NAD-dependent aldehyde dehydrogenase